MSVRDALHQSRNSPARLLPLHEHKSSGVLISDVSPCANAVRIRFPFRCGQPSSPPQNSPLNRATTLATAAGSIGPLLPLLTVITIVADGDDGNTVVVDTNNVVEVVDDAFFVVIAHDGVTDTIVEAVSADEKVSR